MARLPLRCAAPRCQQRWQGATAGAALGSGRLGGARCARPLPALASAGVSCTRWNGYSYAVTNCVARRSHGRPLCLVRVDTTLRRFSVLPQRAARARLAVNVGAGALCAAAGGLAREPLASLHEHALVVHGHRSARTARRVLRAARAARPGCGASAPPAAPLPAGPARATTTVTTGSCCRRAPAARTQRRRIGWGATPRTVCRNCRGCSFARWYVVPRWP